MVAATLMEAVDIPAPAQRPDKAASAVVGGAADGDGVPCTAAGTCPAGRTAVVAWFDLLWHESRVDRGDQTAQTTPGAGSQQNAETVRHEAAGRGVSLPAQAVVACVPFLVAHHRRDCRPAAAAAVAGRYRPCHCRLAEVGAVVHRRRSVTTGVEAEEGARRHPPAAAAAAAEGHPMRAPPPPLLPPARAAGTRP